jgi:uncharacterized protein YcsI (UPF0317 family)|tara:strand:- start:352 stop:537 length:186 start_codon:yes stop_codon:yes gene_type:complete
MKRNLLVAFFLGMSALFENSNITGNVILADYGSKTNVTIGTDWTNLELMDSGISATSCSVV